ncbi:hypothetical protein CPC197_2117, partial [Chlamydia psittaci C1/97]
MILLCDVWIHGTELQQIFDLGGLKQSFCRIREYTFGSPLRPTVKNRISPNKNLKEAVSETALWCVDSS